MTPPEIEQTVKVKISYAMADAEGAAPMRTVAGHLQRVADGWAVTSRAMFDAADALEALVAGSTDETPE